MKPFIPTSLIQVSPVSKSSARALSLSILTLLTGCATQPAPTAPPVAAAAEARSGAHSGAITAKTNAPAAPSESVPAPAPIAGTEILFDGKSLNGWAITEFAGHGEVKVEGGKMLLEMGVMTGVTYTNPVPKTNYEIELDAMRVEGNDFFCGLTFPVGDNPCSLILGGWGGGVVGLSSIDGEDAAHNETSKYMNFERGHWYHVKLRVTPAKIEAWIGKEKLVSVDTQDRTFSIRLEMELSKPLGIATWSTTGAIKDIRVRKL